MGAPADSLGHSGNSAVEANAFSSLWEIDSQLLSKWVNEYHFHMHLIALFGAKYHADEGWKAIMNEFSRLVIGHQNASTRCKYSSCDL
ncbi:hypothetical protein HDF12_003405 [Edaphobacter lichenicola]|uniref:Uncharacterized protein n=1 Tax=Tunturiibacter lichenicola TaxID=2051959 RepID=A0A7Y9T428_9BACT|nr:hypothetical protein [Edaphobacter lichenicola]